MCLSCLNQRRNLTVEGCQYRSVHQDLLRDLLRLSTSTYSQVRQDTHTLTHTHAHTHTHTLTHTHSHPHTRSHTHTHTLFSSKIRVHQVPQGHSRHTHFRSRFIPD